MPQKFPEIGLRAVFETAGLSKGYAQYQRIMRGVDRVTNQTAQNITQNMRDIPGKIARTWDELGRSLEVDKWGLDESQIREMQQAFSTLGATARVNVDVFDELAEKGVNLSDAMLTAGGAIRFNLDAWRQMVNAGASGQQAFDLVADAVARARRQMAFWSVATAAGAVVLRFMVNQMREAIESYDELAVSTRRLSFQTGLLTKEASAWVNIAETAGLSAASFERAITSFLAKASDLHGEMLRGEQSSSQFASAMEFLGVSVTGAGDKLKPTKQLLKEVNEAFQELGPGGATTDAAKALFGFSGRNLIELLTDTERSLRDLTEATDEYGASLGAIDTEKNLELAKSQDKVNLSSQGLQNTWGRGWTEARIAINEWWADSLNTLRQADARIRAFQKVLEDLRTGQTGFKGLDFGEEFQKQVDFFLTGETEMARAAEELKQTEFDAVQAARETALARREALRDTLDALDEFKDKYKEKLDSINADAKQKWEDILVNRMRDAADRALQNVFKLEDLRQALNAKMDAIERDFAKRWDDILVKRQREALERGIALAQRFEDLTRATEQRRQDAIRSFQDREVKQHRDLQRRVQEIERDSRDKREKLERDHRERLFKIQQNYLDTVQEAARSNDAVAVARAMRERDRAVRDEARRFGNEQRDLDDSLLKKREDIDRDRREREDDQKKELARTLQRIEENANRQRQEIVRQNNRAREARQRAEALELEDFNKAKAEQKQAALDAYQKGRDDLDKANKRADILRKIQYERQERDFVQSWQRRIQEARSWYQQERNDLAQHLNITGQQLEQAYRLWANQAASAAAAVARVIASATAGGGNLGIIGGRGISMAEGGVVQANSPTNVVMGDAGPEMGIFLPGGSSSMNVNHNFGRMGVDIEGLPGGMNTPQITSLFYQLMGQLAKKIQVTRS